MKNVYKYYIDKIILGIGFILIFGGVIGAVTVFSPNGFGSNAGNAAPTEIQVALAPLELPTNSVNQLSQTAQPTLAAPPSSSLHGINILASRNYSVHADPKSGLEMPLIPDRIVIPSVGIDATVVIADYNKIKLDGETFGQWQAPNELAAGWQPDSALLGQPGNTVINGHHNEFGEVFGKLVDVKVGDKISVYSKGKRFNFIVANRMILQELYVSTETRLQNARWLAQSEDVRLTLVTCLPKISNTHRLIIVASPDYSTN
jgi:LPXTG-site transpeptidase (sortase) family protein